MSRPDFVPTRIRVPQDIWEQARRMAAVAFHVGETGRTGKPVAKGAFKRVEALLAETFGGFTVRRARGSWSSPGREIHHERVRVYEVVVLNLVLPDWLVDRSARALIDECARKIAAATNQETVLVNTGDETFAVSASGAHARTRRILETLTPLEPPRVSDWGLSHSLLRIES